MTGIVLDALAVWRLWRLAAKDDITAPVRDRWEAWMWDRARGNIEPGHAPSVPKAIVLVGCPFCLGFWLCFAAVFWSHTHPRSWHVVRHVLAASAIVGLIAEAESRLEH